ncbi:unnamed protein product, partial [Aureobasidium pullulans]
ITSTCTPTIIWPPVIKWMEIPNEQLLVDYKDIIEIAHNYHDMKLGSADEDLYLRLGFVRLDQKGEKSLKRPSGGPRPFRITRQSLYHAGLCFDQFEELEASFHGDHVDELIMSDCHMLLSAFTDNRSIISDTLVRLEIKGRPYLRHDPASERTTHPPIALFERRHAAFPWGELLSNSCNGDKIDTGLNSFLVSVLSSIAGHNSPYTWKPRYMTGSALAPQSSISQKKDRYMSIALPCSVQEMQHADDILMRNILPLQSSRMQSLDMPLLCSPFRTSLHLLLFFLYISRPDLHVRHRYFQKDDIGPFRTMELQKTLQRGVQVMSPILNMTLLPNPSKQDLTLEKWRTSTTTAKETPSTTFSTARYLRSSSSQPGTISPLVSPRLSPSMKTLLRGMAHVYYDTLRDTGIALEEPAAHLPQ